MKSSSLKIVILLITREPHSAPSGIGGGRRTPPHRATVVRPRVGRGGAYTGREFFFARRLRSAPLGSDTRVLSNSILDSASRAAIGVPGPYRTVNRPWEFYIHSSSPAAIGVAGPYRIANCGRSILDSSAQRNYIDSAQLY